MEQNNIDEMLAIEDGPATDGYDDGLSESLGAPSEPATPLLAIMPAPATEAAAMPVERFPDTQIVESPGPVAGVATHEPPNMVNAEAEEMPEKAAKGHKFGSEEAAGKLSLFDAQQLRMKLLSRKESIRPAWMTITLLHAGIG